MKIFVAVPTYDRKLCVETVIALLAEQAAARKSGDHLDFWFVPGISLVTVARNQAVVHFLESDCERLFFLDADIAWQQGDLLKLCRKPAEFVGGAYRFKSDPEDYPVLWPPGEKISTDRNGLLSVRGLPAGFLCLARTVFPKLKAKFPGRTYKWAGKTHDAYFHASFYDGELTGEDTAFCSDWIAVGGEVFLDPTLALTHVDGSRAYTGCIGEWLKRRDS